MKKILIVIAPENFRDEEYIEPKKIFEDRGFEIKTASLKAGEATGMFGAKVKIDLLISEVNSDEFSAVVFVGGRGMAKLTANREFIDLAQKFYQAGKLTTAICVAPAILANAGILKNKKATSWPDVKDELTKGGADYTGRDVEIDGGIITGNGPQAAGKFGETTANAV
ncbi:MAG: hypothetical protein UU85_C0001G0080 [Candidatus Wolfebacteria bacterium GW2011_GWA2_42_10]|uniref:DJ-1/PfpI domain-containing protein n=2 Tax=Candidatus Wolfeibacteriota TaxID=1752735 RepID=A0A0G0XL93_9BACT|nr:MAG: hypothetical protein UU38_C0003G0146 [Candidatus Wolfebacteria bacterium GW2011_GWB1_41_12]KKS25650.1 MAG: hypothetical protein UU85_C0001G0080 [Candidatus Wolfebacteria bacterium GW2011_GWA2_42_10]KKT56460.1 MAG: hypothetical protein UW50_C0001G0027 [Candidatus Wolfebacteria bacterium GW2011_GWA1_44_24]